MRILYQTRDQNAPTLGIPTFAQDIIGDVFAGESAWEYRLSGYVITVGYYHDVAKYVAFRKQDGAYLQDSDIHSVLGFMGSNSLWKSTGTDYSYSEPSAVVGGPAIEASAWYSSKGYLFAYVPGLLVDRDAIDKEMPGASPGSVKAPAKPSK